MQRVAKRHSDRLDELKKYISDSYEYFQENFKRYNDFRKYVFKSSLTQEQLNTLNELKKPTTEFNILEAYISRLRGEFSRQEPSITVRTAGGIPTSAMTQELVDTTEVLEGHLKTIFNNSSNDMLQYNVFTDLLAGGFSVMKVYTEYLNEMSFDQVLKSDRVFDPTMTGFDPLARASHKGDGRFCYEVYPMTKDDFETEFGKDLMGDMSFSNVNLDEFNWSYKGEKEDIVLVADIYVKEPKETKIVKLSNGYVVTKKKYQDFLDLWENTPTLELPPAIVAERTTFLTEIWRYRICETGVLDAKLTDFEMFPLVFVDGNSVILNNSGVSYQFTRPYCYHARGIQDLKNYAGQTLGYKLETLINHKWVAAVEAVPEDYLDAYKDPQSAQTLLYNHYYNDNPEQVLPQPREVQDAPVPPIINETFQLTDSMTQAILGSYDAQAGVNRADLSGIAFARSAMQSNNASMPYIVGYIKGINRVAEIIIDMIPKYYVTPRTLPVELPDGKREYVVINSKETESGREISMKYDPKHLQVEIETGVNFAIQKEIALQTIINLMQASELFASFINSEGLEILIDNIDIRGMDALKLKVKEFEDKMKRQEAMDMQERQFKLQQAQKEAQLADIQAQKEINSPTQGQLGQAAIEQEANKTRQKTQIDAAKVGIEQQKADTDFIKVMAEVNARNVENDIREAEIVAENNRTAVDAIEAQAKLQDEGAKDANKEEE